MRDSKAAFLGTIRLTYHAKGEGFAVDASVMETDASRYHGQPPGEIDWSAPERQTRAVAEFLSGLDDEDPRRIASCPR